MLRFPLAKFPYYSIIGQVISTTSDYSYPLIFTKSFRRFSPVIVSIIQGGDSRKRTLRYLKLATIIKGVVIRRFIYILSIVQAVFSSYYGRNNLCYLDKSTHIIKLFHFSFKGDWSGAWNAVKGLTSSVTSINRKISSRGDKF
ncbi:hypothetical protein CW304_30155 [Bacillus sp. UFRGS-B20]|nr:hypothetical protein CW304_30155 [Bacillus sp. UFRGS-B20]